MINEYWIRTRKYFTCNTVFINTGFNPTNKNATIKYMDVVRSTFTTRRGT